MLDASYKINTNSDPFLITLILATTTVEMCKADD